MTYKFLEGVQFLGQVVGLNDVTPTVLLADGSSLRDENSHYSLDLVLVNHLGERKLTRVRVGPDIAAFFHISGRPIGTAFFRDAERPPIGVARPTCPRCRNALTFVHGDQSWVCPQGHPEGWIPAIGDRSATAQLARELTGTFTVNGMECSLGKSVLEYEDVVKLAYPGVVWTNMPKDLLISYRNADQPDGFLVYGALLRVKHGTVINVDDLPLDSTCPDCGEPQFECPSGVTCKNGHGY
jgi:hypothetical protein